MKEKLHKINKNITATEVRLIGQFEDSGKIFKLSEALLIAKEMNLDLVEICSNSNPSVCKLINYKKFIFDIKKNKKDQKKKSKSQETKEIRLGPNIDEHDFNFKMKNAQKFLIDGDIVRLVVNFKGREINFKDKGELILVRMANELIDFGRPDNVQPKLEGKKMIMFIKPKKQK